jgi:hypothetical protein
MGQSKGNKIKKKKSKSKLFTRAGFVKRLMEAGWKMKEAVREYKRIREGTDGVEQDCYPD